MSPINSATVAVRFFDGVEVTSYRGEDDNAKVIQIDTQHDEHVRINLNDAPVFDGSPESDEPLAVKVVELKVVGVSLAQLEQLAKNAHDEKAFYSYQLWEEADSKTQNEAIATHRVLLEEAGIVVEM